MRDFDDITIYKRWPEGFEVSGMVGIYTKEVYASFSAVEFEQLDSNTTYTRLNTALMWEYIRSNQVAYLI
jgi:hypothetical protein